MTKKLTIYIGSDHGGFELKEKVKSFLKNFEYLVEDLGAHSLIENDDYPDYAFLVANRVVKNPHSIGVLLCRSGGGMVIAANKVKGVRAVVVCDKNSAIHAKEHNNANVISLPADWIKENQEKTVLLAFLNASFKHQVRHVRRLNKIKNFEEQKI